MDQKLRGFGGSQRGRIILLGDGSEVLTDSDDTDMFDQRDEDNDVASLANKSLTSSDAVPEKVEKANSEKVESSK